MDSLAAFSERYFLRAKQHLIKLLIKDKVSSDAPKGYILGGQSGAGKTTLQTIISKKNNHNVIVLNGDEFRSFHPQFKELDKKYGKDSVKYTGVFSGQMTEALIEELSNRNYHLIIEGTLRTVDVPQQTCQTLKDKGYHVELSVMAVKPELSYLSTILRYEMMLDNGMIARATPKVHHDLIVEKIVPNLHSLYKSQVFDTISIFNRDKECLYNQEDTPKRDPGDVVNKVFNGEWTPSEKKDFATNIEKTKLLMKKRNAPELANLLDYEKSIEKRIKNAFQMKVNKESKKRDSGIER